MMMRQVTFLSVMRHMHLDDSQQPPALFYQLLREDYSIANVLQHLYQFVSGPIHPCENCNRQWAVTSAANRERLDVMREYVVAPPVSSCRCRELAVGTPHCIESARRGLMTMLRCVARLRLRRYEPMRMHPELFAGQWQERWLAPALVAAVKDGSAAALDALLTRHAEGVYSFPMFTDAFCDELLQEVEHYADSGLPIRRPNSMNNYGSVLCPNST
jgi:hypothetical protein